MKDLAEKGTKVSAGLAVNRTEEPCFLFNKIIINRLLIINRDLYSVE